MIVSIHIFPVNEIIPVSAGYIKSDDFNAERFFQMCNWKINNSKKPTELNSDVMSVGRGICFTNPITGEKWLSKSFGWFVGNSIEVSEYVRKHQYMPVWE